MRARRARADEGAEAGERDHGQGDQGRAVSAPAGSTPSEATAIASIAITPSTENARWAVDSASTYAAERHELALVDEAEALDHALGLEHVVGDEDDRAAVTAEGAQEVPDQAARVGGEICFVGRAAVSLQKRS